MNGPLTRDERLRASAQLVEQPFELGRERVVEMHPLTGDGVIERKRRCVQERTIERK